MDTRKYSRRGAMIAGAAALVTGGLLAAPTGVMAGQDAPPMPANVYTDGVAGGGVVPTPLGEAQFSVAAFAMDPGDGSQPIIKGSFSLYDASSPAAPVQIDAQSIVSISAYSTDLPNARQVIGWATVNGGGPYPFLLQVEDLGPAGSGGDSLNFVFGESAAPYVTGGSDKSQLCDCGGYSYSLKGTVTMGDIIRFPMSATA